MTSRPSSAARRLGIATLFLMLVSVLLSRPTSAAPPPAPTPSLPTLTTLTVSPTRVLGGSPAAGVVRMSGIVRAGATPAWLTVANVAFG